MIRYAVDYSKELKDEPLLATFSGLFYTFFPRGYPKFPSLRFCSFRHQNHPGNNKKHGNPFGFPCCIMEVPPRFKLGNKGFAVGPSRCFPLHENPYFTGFFAILVLLKMLDFPIGDLLGPLFLATMKDLYSQKPCFSY